ncbi:PREDICTED: neuromedin-B receptor-like [Wasmannia auropunctata]|uniref:neuromedin-B receptor-like n=1 Tax=Wasmannia auropunctata TaxID=64793 RepID=UPI0005F019DF|nr:PREDICTED: neuromedin-B receptor-like [Wasmannia auropunctata]
MAMSWPYATSASPFDASITMLMTTRLTPLALTPNYTMEASDFAGNITSDTNGQEQKYTPYSERPETYFVPIIFLLILLIGLTGNGVLALTILRHTNMRNVPNTYVLSLALGDLLVRSGRRATRFTIIVAVLIWVLAIVCAIPANFAYIRFFKVNRNVSFYVCYPFPEEFGTTYPKVIVMGRFLIYYIIPLSIIAIFYMLMARHLMRSTKNIIGEMQGQVKQVQARKKVAKMVMAFVIVFAVCFFPQHVFMMWFYFHPTVQKDYNAFWHYFRILGFCLAFINSCINPIALYCVSGTFRKYFDRYLFCCISKKMQNRYRRSSDQSSRGRGQSFSLVSSRKYMSDSRREQRSVMRLSTMAGDIRPATPIKEQETTITLSAYPNGVDESLRNQRTWTEPTIHDRLVTS